METGNEKPVFIFLGLKITVTGFYCIYYHGFKKDILIIKITIILIFKPWCILLVFYLYFNLPTPKSCYTACERQQNSLMKKQKQEERCRKTLIAGNNDSRVWKHFLHCKDLELAKCKTCSKEIKEHLPVE